VAGKRKAFSCKTCHEAGKRKAVFSLKCVIMALVRRNRFVVAVPLTLARFEMALGKAAESRRSPRRWRDILWPT
jgi:hypothetical protein